MRIFSQIHRNDFRLIKITTIFVMHAFIIAGIHADPAVQIDDETCLDCHEGLDKTLSFGPHRLASQITNPATIVSCVSCHSDAENHLEDPDIGTIGNVSKLSGYEAVKICLDCHVAHVELDDYGFNAHSETDMNCSSCHVIHSQNQDLLLDEGAEFCLTCHRDKSTASMRVSNHPILQGNVTCLSCHRFVKRLDDNPAYGSAGVCRDCHPEQAGPFLYEHEAINAYSLEGSGCTECHDPHGSENTALLKQPADQICGQCHFPAGHIAAHGGIFAEYDCRVCHTGTHGSFISSLYLDDDLSVKIPGCDAYRIGCHSLSR